MARKVFVVWKIALKFLKQKIQPNSIEPVGFFSVFCVFWYCIIIPERPDYVPEWELLPLYSRAAVPFRMFRVRSAGSMP